MPGAQPQAAPAAAGELGQLPVRSEFPHLPAIPLDPVGMVDTLGKLEVRSQQQKQPRQGFNRRFTIGGRTRTGYAFLFGDPAPGVSSLEQGQLVQELQKPPAQVAGFVHQSMRSQTPATAAAGGPAPPLERPAQFSISWTSFPNVYEAGLPSLSTWSASLTDAEAATSQFWPMIAEHGYGYNLIIPERVTGAKAAALRRRFGGSWSRQLAAAQASGNLYVIDMSRFEALDAHSVDGAPRFTPATITLLVRNPRGKTLTPVAIQVSGRNGRGRRTYVWGTATAGAWLYALQAAKTSITVYGIWLGHVYHWHIVTAAMQMTMLNTLPTSHPLYQMIAPQSKYVIPFDDVLLVAWSQIAPPTSISTGFEFLALCNDFARGRSYFDDDPKVTLRRLGLRQADFSVSQPWDRYPVVRRLLELWDLVETYVQSCVRATYGSDGAVAGDASLQTWLRTAGSPSGNGGNIRGLPRMNSRAALERVVTSLLYRVLAHGIPSLPSTTNPALTFVANYPPCLQRTDIPNPRARLGTGALLSYLPNTATIGATMAFGFTFSFSPPYEHFIPLGGVDTELFFPGGSRAPRNQALIGLRNGLAAFIQDYDPDNARFQWPLNVEL